MTRHKGETVRPIALGRSDAKGAILLRDGEVQDLSNVELDRDSLASGRGSIKFGNQVAPSSALETRIDRGFGRLPVLPGKSAPLRGYVYIPYDERQDIGGVKARADFDVGTEAASDAVGFYPTYNAQRGQSFELSISFRIPEEERLFNPTNGKLGNPAAGFQARIGDDIAMDEFTAIVQKGGDRLQPMSWALGIVNTGDLWDTAISTDGTNIFGVPTSLHRDRQCNYCLCFMWLDAPKFGEQFPVQMRYRLTNGQIFADDTPAGGGGHEGAEFGAYCTHAYRAMVIPKFVEPGRNYHVALQLQLDAGTPGTGAEPTVSWQNNGRVRVVVMTDGGRGSQTFEYAQATPAAATIYRYKGPADSLDYFTKYGVRYWGPDPMYLGLGYRYAPWAAAGFMPFGIDSAPLEKGGFRIIDQSIHVPSVYTESSTPDTTSGAGGPSYFLRIAHDSAVDLTGRLIDVSDRGFVHNVGSYPGVTWGSANAQWAGISPAGRSPLGSRFCALSDPANPSPGTPFDDHWRGLGGNFGGVGAGTANQGRGFNPEALRGYRIVLAPDSPATGFSNVGAAGGLLSFKQYIPASSNGIFNFSFETEGDLTPWIGGNPNFNGIAFKAYVRAFRWSQRPLVFSDLRIYSAPRDYSDPRASLSLLRFPDLQDSSEPGIATLVGSWRFDEADAGELLDQVAGVSAYRAPYTMARSTNGTKGENELFLSGDGESLRLDFGQNPFLRELISDMQLHGRSGFAVEITCRIPEACYGIPRKKTTGAGASTDVWSGKFGPNLIAWEVADPVSGLEEDPPPLILFGQGVQLTGFAAGTNTATGPIESPFAEPLAFDMRVPRQSDQEVSAITTPPDLESWVYDGGTPSITPRWNKEASWVGKSVTFQVGVEPTATPELFRAYIAAAPQGTLGPTQGTPGSEFALFDEITLDRRRLERTVVVIGGTWDPRRRGFIEASSRLIVDEVRVYGATAPGELPELSGGEPDRGAGKILGGRSHPQRRLELADILRPLAGVSSALDVTRGSTTASVSGGVPVPTDGPETSIDALDRSLIVIGEETLVVPRKETFWRRHVRPYLVSSISGAGLVLSSPYFGATRRGAAAASFRLIGYTAFEELESPSALRPLNLGSGRGYDVETASVEAASITERLFTSLAPVRVDFDVRTYTPLASARPRDIAPRWVRGMKAGNDNPILGIHALETTIYAGVKGALYEADDRWRPGGPSRTFSKSLAFRGRRGESRIPLPAANDRAEQVRSDLNLKTLIEPGGGAIRSVLWDVWVKIDNYGRYHTIEWYGNQEEAHAQYWLRLDNGYPELVVSSLDTAVGEGIIPDQGYYVARGDGRVPLGVRTHLRWSITTDTAVSRSLQRPKLAINGKRVTVTINDKGTAAGPDVDDWLHLPTLYPTQGETLDYLLVGCARAIHYRSGKIPAATVPQNISQQDTEPTRHQGFLDVLEGEISYLTTVQLFTGGPTATAVSDFDPFTAKYGVQDVVKVSVLREDLDQYGVGHKLLDTASNTYLTIASHPFVSLWHEMGRSDKLFSFANYSGETFVANGTRPIVIEGPERSQIDVPRAREAGVREPKVQPTVEVQRQPIFREAFFNFGGSVENDPIIQRDLTDRTVTNPNYIYRNVGSLYLVQADVPGSTLSWIEDTYLTFKCLVKPSRVDGRISLFSRRGSVSSGVFIEIRDGRCVLGWYDMSQKREVTIATSHDVFKPGFWHYVYVRKWFPRGGQRAGAFIGSGSLAGSNWQNAIFSENYVDANEAIAHDEMIVRRVPIAAHSEIFDNFTGYDLKNHIAYPGGGTWAAAGSSNRACVSFTVDDVDWSTLGVGHTVTLTGLVASYATAAPAGTNINISGAGNDAFLLDHVGMLVQFSQGPRAGSVYRIVAINSVTQVKVVDELNTSPAFTAGDGAGRLVIATGVTLIKSAGFDDSTSPDNSGYAIEVFGDAVSGDPLSGVQGTFADFISFAMVAAVGENYHAGGTANYGSPNIFEDAGAKLTAGTIVSGVEIGTDAFGDNATNYLGTVLIGLPFQGCPLQRLEVDTPDLAFAAVDVRGYAANDGTLVTRQPNSDQGPLNDEPGLTLDPLPSSATEEFVFRHTREIIGGTRNLLITFYDPENDVESFPNSTPEGTPNPVVVEVGTEERNNPSGSINLVVTGWPKPVEDRRIFVRVYITPLETLDFFRVAEVDASRSDSIAIELDDTLLSAGTPLSLLTGAPPDCSVIAVSQSAMVYASLPGDEDVLMHSLPAFPESVPPNYVNQVDTGSGRGITAVGELSGLLIVAKSSGIWAGTISGSAIAWSTVTLSDGCVSHAAFRVLEDRIYLVAPRGPMLIVPGDENRPVPFFLGKRTQAYFQDVIDPASLARCAAALYWRRNQFIFTVGERGRLLMDGRVALEFDHPLAGSGQINELVAGHRFSRYRGPALTRLGVALPVGGGAGVLIGGTQDGFLVWMDRADTSLHLLGTRGPVGVVPPWGDSELVSAGAGVVTGDVDLTQEGARGATLRWLTGTADAPVENEGYVLLAYQSGGGAILVLRTDEGGENQLAIVNTVLTLGAQLHSIRTKEYDADTPQLEKEVHFLDVSRKATGGTLKVDVYRDMETNPRGTVELDLSKTFQALNVGPWIKRARCFSFGFRTQTPSTQGSVVDSSFELYDITTRHEETDNR